MIAEQDFPHQDAINNYYSQINTAIKGLHGRVGDVLKQHE